MWIERVVDSAGAFPVLHSGWGRRSGPVGLESVRQHRSSTLFLISTYHRCVFRPGLALHPTTVLLCQSVVVSVQALECSVR